MGQQLWLLHYKFSSCSALGLALHAAPVPPVSPRRPAGAPAPCQQAEGTAAAWRRPECERGAQAGLWGEVRRGGAEGRVGKERRWRAGSSLLSSLIPPSSAEEGTFPARVSASSGPAHFWLIQRHHLPPGVPAFPRSPGCRHQLLGPGCCSLRQWRSKP